eukprot:4661615-Prymnesium_polylepis.2
MAELASLGIAALALCKVAARHVLWALLCARPWRWSPCGHLEVSTRLPRRGLDRSESLRAWQGLGLRHSFLGLRSEILHLPIRPHSSIYCAARIARFAASSVGKDHPCPFLSRSEACELPSQESRRAHLAEPRCVLDWRPAIHRRMPSRGPLPGIVLMNICCADVRCGLSVLKSARTERAGLTVSAVVLMNNLGRVHSFGTHTVADGRCCRQR